MEQLFKLGKGKEFLIACNHFSMLGLTLIHTCYWKGPLTPDQNDGHYLIYNIETFFFILTKEDMYVN